MWMNWGRAIRQFLDDARFRDNRRVRLGIYIVLGLAMFVILVNTVLPQQYQFAVGQTSPVTIVAPVTAVDTEATEKARAAAAAKVPKRYVQLSSVETRALNRLTQFFHVATELASDTRMPSARKLNQLSAAAPKKVSQATLQALLAMKVQQIQVVDSVSQRIVRALLGAPFNQQSMQQAALLIDRQLLPYDLDRVSQLVVENVVESVLEPNMQYQAQATQAAREQAADAVPPVMIEKGDVIVSRNGIITPQVQSKLRDVGLYSARPNYGMVVGFALFIVIAIGLLAAYIERRSPRRRIDNLLLLVTSLVLLLMAVIISVAKNVISAGGSSSLASLVPIAVGAMLISVLIDASLAVVVSFFLSLLYGAALGFDYWYVFQAFIASLVGAYSVAKVTHRGTFMRAGFFVAGVNVLSVCTTYLLQSGMDVPFRTLSLHVGLGALNGIISAVLTMGILPFVESAFGLLTAIHLLELSNPNNPLLRKVLMEAPGTYHHSLIVGNLAEAAAELVGADPLICRVGAYYHDVGKTRRPLFFVENQMTKENPHDKIAPSLSHLIITSHVSDGLEMLTKAGLPKPIRDICATHHGTTALWYFYNKAKELDKNGTVKLDDFRYPGPKPKTRECAIVMICDAVEAAVRSMSRPTPGRVEGVIRKIIRDRLEDGQLDECDLTLQDLDAMVGAFMKTLKGIYHARIEYPDVEKIRKEVAK
ncbi:MAG: HDIG domain-containing protein [Alicyclobacillus sp.]|nr:HDIG domain-containing protein [Alicyclobacillus sp.]